MRAGFRTAKGDRFLLRFLEYTRMPHTLCGLLRKTTSGIEGPINGAPLFDSGWEGFGMCHWCCDKDNAQLVPGQLIGTMDLYRVPKPDRIYGAASGASYQLQKGLQPANNFKPIDWGYVARTHKKLDRKVLVQDARRITHCRSGADGFEFFTPGSRQLMLDEIKDGFFTSRFDCEDDELLLQAVPYIIIANGNRVFTYCRADDIAKYGEPKLFGKWSIGVGGHVNEEDGRELTPTLDRVLRDEVRFSSQYGRHCKTGRPQLVGSVLTRALPVDRVHVGLVYVVHTNGRVQPASESIAKGGMESIDTLADRMNQYESWSRALIPLLQGIVRG
jgi:predicted NUDIX family phosphoesterase